MAGGYLQFEWWVCRSHFKTCPRIEFSSGPIIVFISWTFMEKWISVQNFQKWSFWGTFGLFHVFRQKYSKKGQNTLKWSYFKTRSARSCYTCDEGSFYRFVDIQTRIYDRKFESRQQGTKITTKHNATLLFTSLVISGHKMDFWQILEEQILISAFFKGSFPYQSKSLNIP